MVFVYVVCSQVFSIVFQVLFAIIIGFNVIIILHDIDWINANERIDYLIILIEPILGNGIACDKKASCNSHLGHRQNNLIALI